MICNKSLYFSPVFHCYDILPQIHPMVFLANLDPNLSKFVLIGALIMAIGLLLRWLKQPSVIGYILAGVLMGEHGLDVLTDEAVIASMGEFGLILLLFFIGMETDLNSLVKNWKASILSTVLQIGGSVLIVALIGLWLDWGVARVIVLGFVVSLSSSAVVIKMLQDKGEAQSLIGQNVISILLTQDILIVPILIATNYLGGQLPETSEIILQLVGGILLVSLMAYVIKKKNIRFPYSEKIEEDHELQVFVAFNSCFGFALITALFGLSAALGAFVAGILVHSAQSTNWFHESLHSFRVVFVALFFISIGMLIDLNFLVVHWKTIGFLILAVYVSNHFINAAILHYFDNSWRDSLYGGALLAQIGELSFVVAATAYHSKIITDFSYQTTILVISLTLLLSPFWIAMTKALLFKKAR